MAQVQQTYLDLKSVCRPIVHGCPDLKSVRRPIVHGCCPCARRTAVSLFPTTSRTSEILCYFLLQLYWYLYRYVIPGNYNW